MVDGVKAVVDRANQPAVPKPIVPPGWTATFHVNTNRYYYVEAATGKTQWAAPEGTIIPAAEGGQKGREDAGMPPTDDKMPESTVVPAADGAQKGGEEAGMPKEDERLPQDEVQKCAFQNLLSRVLPFFHLLSSVSSFHCPFDRSLLSQN